METAQGELRVLHYKTYTVIFIFDFQNAEREERNSLLKQHQKPMNSYWNFLAWDPERPP